MIPIVDTPVGAISRRSMPLGVPWEEPTLLDVRATPRPSPTGPPLAPASAAPDRYIVIDWPGMGETVWAVRREIRIGRGDDNHLQWCGDPRISRRHCRFVCVRGEIFLEDGGSSNGTHVDGKRIDRVHIRGGESVRVGSVVFQVLEVRASEHGTGTPAVERRQVAVEPFQRPTVMLVGDELGDVSRELRGAGFSTISAETSAQAAKKLNDCQVVLLDVALDGYASLAGVLRRMDKRSVLVLFSRKPVERLARQLDLTGAFAFVIDEPNSSVVDTMERARKHWAARQEWYTTHPVARRR
jgi:pSer/pThr/pTyr-binding forkhead associated (FHA) protein